MSVYLEEFTEWIKRQGYTVFSITEVFETRSETARPCPAPRCMDCYSIAKAFTTTAIGMLFDRGLLSPEDKLVEVLEIPSSSIKDIRWHDATVDMALGHRLGLEQSELDIDLKTTLSYTEDHLDYVLSKDLASQPGTTYTYTDAAYYILGRMVEKVCGMTLEDYLAKNLFIPMEFEEWAWGSCPKLHTNGASQLFLSSQDIAKLGELYRLGGIWSGKRIISEKWVKTALERSYTFSSMQDGSFCKGGMHGQMLLVMPEKKRTVAWLSYDADNKMMVQKAFQLS